MKAMTVGFMPSDVAPPEPEEVQPPLNRERIVAAALALLNETGLAGLSTRRLARDLGIKSASLYWHFKNKDELLDAMCSEMVRMSLPPPETDAPDFDWVEWLADGARLLRRTALERRDGAQIIARSRTSNEAGRRSVQRHVAVLTDLGFDDTQALFLLQTFRRFAIGSALQEEANLAAGNHGRAAVGDEVFEFGLQLISDGVRKMPEAPA